MYSISIDPENDTPAVLKQYADAFDPGPGWRFLTGTKQNIELVRDRLGDRLEDLNEHTQEVRLGVDMPRMGAGEIDATELIAYIAEETFRLAKDGGGVPGQPRPFEPRPRRP